MKYDRLLHHELKKKHRIRRFIIFCSPLMIIFIWMAWLLVGPWGILPGALLAIYANREKFIAAIHSDEDAEYRVRMMDEYKNMREREEGKSIAQILDDDKYGKE